MSAPMPRKLLPRAGPPVILPPTWKHLSHHRKHGLPALDGCMF